ncbi:MAG: DUF3455 domain-containing protein [Ideonella sp.]|nr:DUF3455 domain-containing protein [Ideonella sp.]
MSQQSPKVVAFMLTTFVVAVVAACSGLQPESSVAGVPAHLEPGTSESLAMVAPARGVQIYECRARKKGGRYEWTFVAPEAVLYDALGHRIGRHYAGPTWEAADGSKVVAAVKERADATTRGAIPWLLLTARPADASGSAGAFAGVTSIQRIHTVGGVAPEAGCTQAASGRVARVAYTADYRFYVGKRSRSAAAGVRRR